MDHHIIQCRLYNHQSFLLLDLSSAGRSLERFSCQKASLDIDIAHLGSQMLIVAYHDWLMRSSNNLLRDQAWSHIYRIRKNIGEELNLAIWRIKTKSPIFHFANIFNTRLIQNFAHDLSVALVQIEQSLVKYLHWRPCLQLLILSNSEHFHVVT